MGSQMQWVMAWVAFQHDPNHNVNGEDGPICNVARIVPTCL
jgi:hypothetical protein